MSLTNIVEKLSKDFKYKFIKYYSNTLYAVIALTLVPIVHDFYNILQHRRTAQQIVAAGHRIEFVARDGPFVKNAQKDIVVYDKNDIYIKTIPAHQTPFYTAALSTFFAFASLSLPFVFLAHRRLPFQETLSFRKAAKVHTVGALCGVVGSLSCLNPNIHDEIRPLFASIAGGYTYLIATMTYRAKLLMDTYRTLSPDLTNPIYVKGRSIELKKSISDAVRSGNVTQAADDAFALCNLLSHLSKHERVFLGWTVDLTSRYRYAANYLYTRMFPTPSRIMGLMARASVMGFKQDPLLKIGERCEGFSLESALYGYELAFPEQKEASFDHLLDVLQQDGGMHAPDVETKNTLLFLRGTMLGKKYVLRAGSDLDAIVEKTTERQSLFTEHKDISIPEIAGMHTRDDCSYVLMRYIDGILLKDYMHKNMTYQFTPLLKRVIRAHAHEGMHGLSSGEEDIPQKIAEDISLSPFFFDDEKARLVDAIPAMTKHMSCLPLAYDVDGNPMNVIVHDDTIVLLDPERRQRTTYMYMLVKLLEEDSPFGYNCESYRIRLPFIHEHCAAFDMPESSYAVAEAQYFAAIIPKTFSQMSYLHGKNRDDTLRNFLRSGIFACDVLLTNYQEMHSFGDLQQFSTVQTTFEKLAQRLPSLLSSERTHLK